MTVHGISSCSGWMRNLSEKGKKCREQRLKAPGGTLIDKEGLLDYWNGEKEDLLASRDESWLFFYLRTLRTASRARIGLNMPVSMGILRVSQGAASGIAEKQLESIRTPCCAGMRKFLREYLPS